MNSRVLLRTGRPVRLSAWRRQELGAGLHSAEVHRHRATVPSMGIRVWGHRFVLVGYVFAAVGGWMLVKKPSKAAFTMLAVGATLQMIGGLLQH